MRVFVDHVGEKYNRLTITRLAGKVAGNYKWECQCDCGNTSIVQLGNLKNQTTKSCGCLSKENATKHGFWDSRTYKSWHGMKQRCLNKNNPSYKNYGGRGITVCDDWLKFENFLKDMGERPAKLTLDRINNDGNYEKSNCRWATRKQQANNRRCSNET